MIRFNEQTSTLKRLETDEQRKVAQAIMDHLEAKFIKVLNDAGVEGEISDEQEGPVFYPANSLGWGDGDCVLTVIAEGSDVDHYFSHDACYELACMAESFGARNTGSFYRSVEGMSRMIADLGYFIEPYNSCVYKVYKED